MFGECGSCGWGFGIGCDGLDGGLEGGGRSGNRVVGGSCGILHVVIDFHVRSSHGSASRAPEYIQRGVNQGVYFFFAQRSWMNQIPRSGANDLDPELRPSNAPFVLSAETQPS